MDSKEPTHFGKMSTPRAAMGNEGMLRRPVCVDTSVLPSGNTTVTGCFVTLTSRMMCVSSREIKFPVVPVSAFAKIGVECLLASAVVKLFLKTVTTGCALSPSTPTLQAGFPFIWLV